MKIILTVLLIAFFYSLTATIISSENISFGDSFYSFAITFGFITIPLLICIVIDQLLMAANRKKKTSRPLVLRVISLSVIYSAGLILINLPDFFRHQSQPGFVRFDDFVEYFSENLLNSFITAIIFALAIPVVDTLLGSRSTKTSPVRTAE